MNMHSEFFSKGKDSVDASLAFQFREEGYLHLRGVVSPQEIAAMRVAGEQYFSSGKSHMFTREFLQIPRLAFLPFNAVIVEKIRSVFGRDFATLSQFSMTANLHNPQWHRDSQSQGGNEYLLDPDYMIAKCAVYLQDNDPEWGGGMEILPRSHGMGPFGYRSSLSRTNPLGKLLRFLQRTARNVRDRLQKPLWLPLKAGDAVLFHANLLHRASQPSADKERGGYKQFGLAHPPREKFKFLIDWEVSPDNRYLMTYMEHQKSRALREGSLYRDSLETRYPSDYDPKLVEHIRHLGARVAHYSEVGVAVREIAQ